MERVDEAWQQMEAVSAGHLPAHCGVVLISADIHSLPVVLTVYYYYVKLVRQPWDVPPCGNNFFIIFHTVLLFICSTLQRNITDFS